MKINFSEIILSFGAYFKFAFMIWGGDNDSRQLILLSICSYINFRKNTMNKNYTCIKWEKSYHWKTVIKIKVFLMFIVH